MRGVKLYNSGDWQQCVTEFESSLTQFFEEEQKCRLVCEDKLNWETFDGANPEVTIIITSLLFIYLFILSDYRVHVSLNAHFRRLFISAAMQA